MTPGGRIRPLNARQAVSCENALTGRCRCRCGGTLHGRGRFADEGERAGLPPTDPHGPPPPPLPAEVVVEYVANRYGPPPLPPLDRPEVDLGGFEQPALDLGEAAP